MGIVLYYKAVDSEPACPDWAIFERSRQKILTELEWTNKVLTSRLGLVICVIAWLFNQIAPYKYNVCVFGPQTKMEKEAPHCKSKQKIS